MKLGKFFQKSILKIGSVWLFEITIKHFRFDEEVITDLIRGKYKNKEMLLLPYVKRHMLNPGQIKELLLKEESFAMLEALRNNNLDEEGERLLGEKCNALLLEAYLLPKGYFEPSRRFKALNEYLLIESFIKSKNETYVAAEVFKAYVDNTSSDLLTNDVLELIVKNDVWASRYILCKCRLKKEQEDFFVANAPQSMAEEYISCQKLWCESAQLYLLEHNFSLAELHYNKYGLRFNAQTIYHAMRRKASAEREAKRKKEATLETKDG